MVPVKEAPALPERATQAETRPTTADDFGHTVGSELTEAAEKANSVGDRKVPLDKEIAARIADVAQLWKATDAEFEAELGNILADAKEALGLQGKNWEKWVVANVTRVTRVTRDRARTLINQALEARKTAVAKPAHGA
jgi:hypothetical protein